MSALSWSGLERLAPSKVVSERLRYRYDPATKVWAQLFAGLFALVVDWFAVVVPHGTQPPSEPAWGWWALATFVAVAPSTAWTLGHIVRRDKEGAIIWGLAASVALVMQLCFAKWALG